MSDTSVTTEPLRSAQAVRLANAWFVLAEAYAPPTSWPAELEQHVAAVFSDLDEPIAGHAAELVRALHAARQDLDQTRVAHARLFIGPYELRAPPYASLYLDPQRQLMGATSRYVASLYAQAGLSPKDGPHDAPDHVLYEFEFMYHLWFQELETGEPRWAELRHRFWSQHLSRWLPQMVALMGADESAHPVYAALAHATTDVITMECAAERESSPARC